MTVSTATSVPIHDTDTAYLDDLFLHARSRSRRVTAAEAALEAATTERERSDGAVAFENTVSNFLASIAVAATEQLKHVAIVAPGYDSDTAGLHNLRPREVDDFVRPIFEASGIADDFIPWREAFPNYEEGDE